MSPPFIQRLHALVLSTDGVAAGASALWLHDLGAEPTEPEVVVERARRRIGGVRSTDLLPRCDITVVDGIRCCTAARAVIDVAARRSRSQVESLVDHAIATGAVRRLRLEDRARALAAPRRQGAVAVLRALESTPEAVAEARSRLEQKAIRTFQRAGAPPPRANYPVRTGGRIRYIDLAWPEHTVAVELDGFAHHGRHEFDDDRARQNDLVADGWTVFRLTWTALQDPDRAIRPVMTMLLARSTS